MCNFGPVWSILIGKAENRLAEVGHDTVQCCVTSPPYWGARLYDTTSTLGLEETQGEYVKNICDIFDCVRDCLKSDGIAWLNIGDGSFCKQNTNRNGATKHLGGSVRGGGEYKTQKRDGQGIIKEKDLCGTPWATALELRRRGWWLRDCIIWHKPAPMPGGAADRFVNAYEYVFMLTKSKRYTFYGDAVAENAISGGTRRKRNVWSIHSASGNGWHFARMPIELAELCIKASTTEGDLVLDPFHGSGTTGIASLRLDRRYVGIESSKKYAKKSERLLEDESRSAGVELA